LPEFGSRLHELIFESNDAILHGLVRHEVIVALTRWEPRIVITDVLINSQDNLLLVAIEYKLIASQVLGNYVYPFYRENT